MDEVQKKRVVVVGGGTGTYTVLSGLKRFTHVLDLTAVVAMSDSGGSTGRLRDEFGYLPVGDVRMALAALAPDFGDEALIRKLFQHRFKATGDIGGHNFGNLFLVALTDILGSEEAAIAAASRVLRVCGEVLPVTNEKVQLCACYKDGTQIIGEHEIDEPHPQAIEQPITALSLTPEAFLHDGARAAIQSADLIIFGPGDLYTSILANCVVTGFPDALKESSATILYIANLMTKHGQTSHMGVREHVDELARYCGRVPHHVLVNSTELPEDLLERYKKENEFPVSTDCSGLPSQAHQLDLLASEKIERAPGDILRRSLIRHDPEKLAHAILQVLKVQI